MKIAANYENLRAGDGEKSPLAGALSSVESKDHSWWKESGNRFYNVACVQHSQNAMIDSNVVAILESELKGVLAE